MSGIETKKDNSPPTAGYFYAQEYNWLNKLLATFLEKRQVIFDSDNNSQIVDAILEMVNFPLYYIDVKLNTNLLSITNAGTTISAITQYNNGQIVYLNNEIGQYDPMGTAYTTKVDTAPQVSLTYDSAYTYYYYPGNTIGLCANNSAVYYNNKFSSVPKLGVNYLFNNTIIVSSGANQDINSGTILSTYDASNPNSAFSFEISYSYSPTFNLSIVAIGNGHYTPSGPNFISNSKWSNAGSPIWNNGSESNSNFIINVLYNNAPVSSDGNNTFENCFFAITKFKSKDNQTGAITLDIYVFDNSLD